jgi:hypothetical protein
VYPLVLGPHITYEILGEASGTVFHISQRLSTEALVNDPSLAVLCAGRSDAESGLSPERFGAAMADAVGELASRGVDCIVLEPLALSSGRGGAFGETLGKVWPFVRELRDRLGTVPASGTGRVLFDLNSALLPERLVFGSLEDLAYVEEDLRSRMAERVAEGGELTRLGNGQLARSLLETLSGSLVNERERVEMEWRGSAPDRWEWNVATGSEEGPGGFLFLGWLGEWRPRQAAYGFPATAGERWPLTILWERQNGERESGPAPGWQRRVPCLETVGSTVVLRELANPDGSAPPRLQPSFAGNVSRSLRLNVIEGEGSAGPPEWEVAATSAPWSAPFNLGRDPEQAGSWQMSFPDAEEGIRIGGEILLTGGSGGSVWRKSFSGMRNLGLGQRVRLVPDDPGALGEAQTDPLIEPGVTFSAEADSEEFRLHFDIRRIDLEGDSGSPAVELALGLDARSFGERIGAGYLGSLKFTAGASDGPVALSGVGPAVFGDGYARLPRAAAVQASWGGRPNGDRRLAVAIRRRVFYRHDWTLGNGNSQLGIRAELRLRLPGREEPLRFALLPTTRHRHDAEGVAVLELTERPTRRWTVHVW